MIATAKRMWTVYPPLSTLGLVAGMVFDSAPGEFTWVSASHGFWRTTRLFVMGVGIVSGVGSRID